jgi:hypothetical protein
VVADQARDVFYKHCASCHGNGEAPRGGLRLFGADPVARGVIVPHQPDSSELVQLIESGTMPPGTRPKVPEAERTLLREWIQKGASPFARPDSESYALLKILRDVRREKEAGHDVADLRYLSLNHLLADGQNADLPLHRAALAKALNHLSTQKQIVTPVSIDAPLDTVYRIRLSELGWDWTPFTKRADATLYDLVLLEYPLATLPPHSPVGQRIVEEYLAAVPMLRPIPYVRGDWLASVATQYPLYNDLLRLPPTLAGLEKRVGVAAGPNMKRAGITASAIVNGNRLVERRSSGDGYLWRTYDLIGRRGLDELLADAGDTQYAAPGEVIFPLRNGLPGYFIADGRGIREDEMYPWQLNELRKKTGERIGLSCLTCHTRGLEKVKDECRPNAKGDQAASLRALYPEEADFAALMDMDNAGFAAALKQVPFNVPDREPLAPVARRFFKEMESRRAWPNDTLVSLDGRPRKTGWDDAIVSADRGKVFAQMDRGGAPGAALPPLDADGLPRVVGAEATVEFEVTTIDARSGQEKHVFFPGDQIRFRVKNTGKTTMHFEMIATEASGDIVAVLKGKLATLDPSKEYYFPPKTEAGIEFDELDEEDTTRQKCVVYASSAAFPPGMVLNMGDREKRAPGDAVSPRFVHTFHKIEDGRVVTVFDPAKMVKHMVVFETQVEFSGVIRRLIKRIKLY